MGLLQNLRPLGGFPWYVQCLSLSAFAALLLTLLSSSYPHWVLKAAILLVLFVVYWMPRRIVVFVQALFDSRDVLFLYPEAVAKQAAGKKGLPPIALTIDDAPACAYDRRAANVCCTEQIRALLEKHGARATWFVIGSHVQEDRQELLQRLVTEGHELANHGMIDRPAVLLGREAFRADTEEAQRIVESCGGKRRWYRPGHALFTPDQLRWLRSKGFQLALGSIYPHDALDLPPWQCSFPRILAWLLVAKARAGDVIIIHDRPWTPRVLEIALPLLVSRFSVGTLSDLVDACEGPAAKQATTAEAAPFVNGDAASAGRRRATPTTTTTEAAAAD
eukprot:TRINITY_DN16167_c0_g1_i1.p1 TRINITY_DN16167_c0_g1~~TRINITY_DN16167_c0_g1_i1.p1  ORF type:complete len:341 (-),score=60.18 TRINITY_DN16167_c0_g1_i1:186-1187(-)